MQKTSGNLLVPMTKDLLQKKQKFTAERLTAQRLRVREKHVPRSQK